MNFMSEKTYIEFEEKESEMLKATKDMLERIYDRMDKDSTLSSDDYGLYTHKNEIGSAIEILRVLYIYDNCYIE